METDTMAAARPEEPESAGIVDPAASGEAVPIVELEPEPLIPAPMEEDDQIREAIDQHVGESEKRAHGPDQIPTRPVPKHPQIISLASQISLASL